MGYKIGLDLGIASIGYSVLATDENGVPFKILQMNSVIFPRAEQPKTGASLAAPRRDKRGLRRRNRRTNFRKHRTKRLFINEGILSEKQIENIYKDPKFERSIYELRVAGLDRLLTNEELFRVLYYFVTHRGFKSNRKFELDPSDPADKKQMGLLLNSIEEIKKDLAEKNYRTVGELYLNDAKYAEHKRNKAYVDGYLGTPSRDLLYAEIEKLFAAQKSLGNSVITAHFEQVYLSGYTDKNGQEHAGIFMTQRDFDEGPGAGPYAGDQILKMIGRCTFEPNENRAAKATATFEYFNLLQKVNSLQYREMVGGDFKPLTGEQRDLLIQAAYQRQALKYTQVRKLLKLNDEASFNLLTYSAKEDKVKTEGTKFIAMNAYHKLVKVLPEELMANTTLLDHIGFALTAYSSDKRRRRYFEEELKLPEAIIEKLLGLNFSKFGHLSLKAMQNIIPYLEMGQVYSEAAENAGYDFKSKQINFDEDITNPVVRRTVYKTIKVVKQIIRRYGKPDSINIELARELGKTLEKRKEITKQQEEGRQRNEKVAEKLRELGLNVNGENIIRYKLFEEQNEFDPYTGQKIKLTQAFTGSYDIDHIIPYSISFDDSYGNKVLTSSAANREKGNRIPLDYLADQPDRIAKLEAIATNSIHNPRKRDKLLKRQLSKDEVSGWKKRNINDTRYISKVLYNYFRNEIEFSETLDKKQRVLALNGEVTSKIRGRWRIRKVRENGDVHHAVDAVVIGAISPTFIRKVTHYSYNQEVKYNKALWHTEELNDNEYAKESQKLNAKLFSKIFNDFPLPWDQFRDELEMRTASDPAEFSRNHTWQHYTAEELAALKPIFVVRTPNRKVTGPAHLDTIRSGKLLKEGKVISRTAITNLKINKKGVLGTGDGPYYSDNGGGSVVEKALIEALNAHDNDGKKAFPNGYLEYMDHGTKKLVRKVKFVKKTTISTVLDQGKSAADNGSMVRIDVFKTPKKYVFVPIYVKDTVEKELPNLAVVANKGYGAWSKIESNDEFLFSLYQGDMIHIKSKKGFKPKYNKEKLDSDPEIIADFYGYFNGADIATASIQVTAHDNSYTGRGIGIATLLTFEKYQVDYFGEYHQVKERKRLTFK